MKGRMLTHFAALLAALAGSLIASTEAPAASQLCRQLEARLASANGGGGAALVRKYDDAISRQMEQLGKARGRASDAGCGFTLFSRNVGQCAAINASIERMNTNLDSLQRKRAELSGGGSRRDRARILAALDANGCREETAPVRPAPTQQVRLNDGQTVEQLSGSAGQVELLGGDENAGRLVLNRPGDAAASRPQGEFRTICVRTCDGFFFPMSNAASAGDFERDQKNCESSCPGTEIQVFYSRGPGDESAEMVSSVTGRPYGELPTAYLYKKANISRPPACGCNAARNFQVIAGNPPPPGQPQADIETTPFIPVPAVKPDPGADPETLANRAGGLDHDAIGRLAAKPVTSPVSALPPEQRKVRVVGPAFLPDPSGAIDLRAPAPKTVQ